MHDDGMETVRICRPPSGAEGGAYEDFRDAVTGYEIIQYTDGPRRNAKLYFSTENFTPDDRYIVYVSSDPDHSADHETCRLDTRTGEIRVLAGREYYGFGMHRSADYGILARNDGMLCEVDMYTGEIRERGTIPEGARIQGGHLTVSNDGTIGCSCQLKNMDESKVTIELINPGNGKSIPLAVTGPCKTGADHHHPSFDRSGNRILFSAPDERGIAQICAIDLNQVQRP